MQVFLLFPSHPHFHNPYMGHYKYYFTLISHIWVICLKDFFMNEKEKTYCKMFGKALRDLRVAKTGKSSILFAY